MRHGVRFGPNRHAPGLHQAAPVRASVCGHTPPVRRSARSEVSPDAVERTGGNPQIGCQRTRTGGLDRPRPRSASRPRADAPTRNAVASSASGLLRIAGGSGSARSRGI